MVTEHPFHIPRAFTPSMGRTCSPIYRGRTRRSGMGHLRTGNGRWTPPVTLGMRPPATRSASQVPSKDLVCSNRRPTLATKNLYCSASRRPVNSSSRGDAETWPGNYASCTFLKATYALTVLLCFCVAVRERCCRRTSTAIYLNQFNKHFVLR